MEDFNGILKGGEEYMVDKIHLTEEELKNINIIKNESFSRPTDTSNGYFGKVYSAQIYVKQTNNG